MKRLCFFVLLLCCSIVTAQPVDDHWSPTVKIDASQSGEMISPFIYGQFIEHLGRCINGGGIWAEMLEDR
ncbi:MAG: hypothetical protein LBU65_04900, partial [Planctomycetaceae bacterium]|nr:hypothetical protein [Planctomycetaceae bacterium]